jgi:hypothetical protein
VETALCHIVVRVEKALDQQEIALGVFLDIEGALNNTSYDSMCTALIRYGAEYTIMRWIRATLEGRLATATIGICSRSVAVCRGCPQEGVLSHLLWCLFVNELLARLSEVSVYSQGYADDICRLTVEKFPNTVSGFIQWALNIVEVWCGELGLSVNLDKTGLVAFTRRRKFLWFVEPRLFGKTLQCSMSGKYLGVIPDSRLTWKEHVDVKVKAKNLMLACRRVCGSRGPGTEDSSLALCRHRYAIRHQCIPGMVAGLSGGQCQEETKQDSKICMLRYNRGNEHYSHQCSGRTYLPPATRFSGTVRQGQPLFASGVWDAGLTCIPIEDAAVSCCGFSSQTPFLI